MMNEEYQQAEPSASVNGRPKIYYHAAVYTPLEPFGAGWWRGECPLPNCSDSEGDSFNVYLTTRGEEIFGCTACGTNGNVLDFVALMHGDELDGWLSSSSDAPGGGSDDDNKNESPEIVWFHRLGEPQPRKFIVEKVGRKAYPLIVYGAGGVAKSFATLAGGIAIASTADTLSRWMGLQVLEHGHVLYVDFELDQDEQHNRVVEVCKGLGVSVPERLAYLSGRGFSRDATFARARKFCKEHKAVAVIIDSVGQAMTGDMDKNRDVNAFYRDYIEPFCAMDVTPMLVDHQGKIQAGEKHKDKSPIGGVYKTNNARSVLQFILDEYDKETKTLEIRVRTHKTNNEPTEPFGIRIKFSPGKVSLSTRELPAEETIDEERVPVAERILAALELEDHTADDLERLTGASYGTIRNKLSGLTGSKKVQEKGYRGRKKLYGSLSSSPPSAGASGDDDNKNGRKNGYVGPNEHLWRERQNR